MQSNLKKSLYLGLAALSFASVASVTANSSNANAAKKHAAAKKVTYKTTNKNLDQSVTFKSTGKNAVYNKAVGKRSVVASLSDMKSKANSNSTKDLFMAYQEGVTSKGVHYYKVVSFDKKVRGFVYNKGVAKTNTTVAANKPANATGYLTNTNRFFNKAYGSQFKTSLKNDYKGMNIAADQFTVSDAVKVNNDQTYYYVTDKNNQLVNGWVNSVYFSNTITDAAKNATNSANAIHVNFVDQSNYGAIAFSKNVNPANLQSNGVYNASDVESAVKNAVNGTGYEYVSGANTAAKGSNLTVIVKQSANVALTPSQLSANIQSYANVGQPNQGPSADNRVNDLKNSFAGVNLTPDQWKLFSGKGTQSFDFNNFEAQLLNAGKPLNQFNSNGKTYTYNADYTRNDAGNKNLLSNGLTFNNASSMKLYYNETDTNQKSNGSYNYNQNLVMNVLNSYANNGNNFAKALSDNNTSADSIDSILGSNYAELPNNTTNIKALKDYVSPIASDDANKAAENTQLTSVANKAKDNYVAAVKGQNVTGVSTQPAFDANSGAIVNTITNNDDLAKVNAFASDKAQTAINNAVSDPVNSNNKTSKKFTAKDIQNYFAQSANQSNLPKGFTDAVAKANF